MKRDNGRRPVARATDAPPPPPRAVPAATVDAVARLLLPVTREEVLLRDVGMSPLARAVGAAASMGALGAAVGAAAYAGGCALGRRPFSARALGRSAMASGAQLGLEAGITSYVEDALAIRRGRVRAYDRVIAGATAGALLGAPGGLRGVRDGAARGALYSFGLMALECLR